MIPDRRTLIIVVAIAVVSVGAATYYYVFSPVIVEGVVDHKGITGEKDGTTYSILLNTPEGIIVKDEDYEQFFSEKDRNAFINETLDYRMKTEYSEINYLVSIRVTSKDPINNLEENQTLAYFASREDFNAMKIGDKVTYEVERFQTATIKHVLSIQDDS